MRSSNRPKAGLKAVPIDLVDLEKLCSLHCTDEDLARYFRVSVRTIEKRLKKIEFSINRGRESGRISLRRLQMKLFEKDRAPMEIWLGRQWLNQCVALPIEPTRSRWRAVEDLMGGD
jgi:hypothetical protein